MNLVKGAFPYFALPFVISLLLVPICKMIGLNLGIYAVENKRTVHHGHIVRMGGVAIYVAFLLSLTLLYKVDDTVTAIAVGGFLVFLGGLLDDIYDLSPKKKLMFQVVAAVFAMTYGKLNLDQIQLFDLTITSPVIRYGITFLWLVGITNAINLIDGLDGLSSGISAIVTMTIGLMGFFMGRRDICVLALLLSGSILGFLPYNFHPASIFVGDCGAQYMGFSIACLSLLGFKTTTIITLGFPILILFIPISDTLIAILRRKLKGQKISEADRGHLHHILMIKLKLGHKRTVLILYLVTLLFASSAVLSYFRPKYGLIMIIILLVGFELFIEFTGMINPMFHPVLSVCNRLFGHPTMIHGADPVDSDYLKEHEVYDNKTGKEISFDEVKDEHVKETIHEVEEEMEEEKK